MEGLLPARCERQLSLTLSAVPCDLCEFRDDLCLKEKVEERAEQAVERTEAALE